jgi:hypothetical protein
MTMSNPAQKEKKYLTMRDLYPHLNDAQLEEAEENFQRYLEIALRIYERLRAEKGIVDNRTFDSPNERP